MPDGNNFTLPMTQEQIADATGLTSVHVNRTLQGLRADGVIKSNNRSIIVDDWQRLAETGDFDPAYLGPVARGRPHLPPRRAHAAPLTMAYANH